MAYKNILVDTGFWIGLYDPNDHYRDSANAILSLIEKNDYVLIPSPTLYEFLNTKFTRRGIEGFKTLMSGGSTSSLNIIDDSPYREIALSKFLDDKGKRYSLVDLVIREILLDSNIRIDYLVTFNTLDFEDVCQRRGVEIIR